ncbi:hypothetical protein [Streptomyces griseorubiginosus]|uniref:hypothetical protein n=1 Tax=Streptomyces griseorubiginosus TaxID=67304 RepID=UPI001FCADFD5|nr:hypothetical protein [Streptomyces griseorubiginosus]
MEVIIDQLVAAGRMAPIPKHVLFFAVIPPLSGMVDVPLARGLGRPEAASPQQLKETSEAPATLVVNGLLASASQVGPST